MEPRRNPLAPIPIRLAALGLALGAALLAGCQRGVSALTGCQTSGGITPICGFKNPEDMVRLPGGSWLLVSQYSQPGDGPGSLLAFRVPDQRRRVLYPTRGERARLDAIGPARGWGSPDCPGPPDPARFAPHGIDVDRPGTRPGRVAVVNHGGRESVELFSLEQVDGAPALGWRGCIVLPEGVFPNDVALLADGGVIVSNMMPPIDDRAAALLAGVGLMLGRDTGSLLEWSAEAGWSELAGSSARAPNGVAVSADGREVYFSEWAGDRLIRLTRDDETGEPDRRAVSLPHHPDNISWTRDGRLLVAGQHGGLGDVIGCGGIEQGTCSLGYSVVRVDPLSLETEVLLEDRGAASVALQVGSDVYIGTFAGDRIAYADYGW